MNAFASALPGYPESDGLQIADSSQQFRWIILLYGNLAALYRSAADVYVAGNLFWYPAKGHPEIVVTPDVFVVFDRPKGDRRSYYQWEEGNTPLTIAFEVLSPGNTFMEMDDKLLFYEEYGVEEYYVFDPINNRLKIYIRRNDTLVRVRQVHNFVSPRLGIRFDLGGAEMVVYRPDGRPFRPFEELYGVLEETTQQVEQAQQQVERAQQLAAHAQQQAHLESQRASRAEQRAALLERLLELTAKAQQATPEELAELQRLHKEIGR